MAIGVAEGISGSLSDTALSDFIQILAWHGRTGVLLAWDGPAQVGLFFEQGRIARALTTQSLDDALYGAVLLSGRVTAGQLQRARAQFRPGSATGWRVLRLLAAEDELDEATLRAAQVAAIRETLRQVLPWKRGQLQFKPNVPPLQGVPLAQLNVEELLIDELRKLDEEVCTLISPSSVVRWAPVPPRGLTAALIGQARWRMLSACNGRRTVAEVAEHLGCDVALAQEQIQWLLDHGAVALVPARAVVLADEAASGMEDRLVLALSRFETLWSSGRRLNRGRVLGGLIDAVNTASQLYLNYWRELVCTEARERTWQALVLPTLQTILSQALGDTVLDLTIDRNALRDGKLMADGTRPVLQAAVERAPGATFDLLARLLERALLLAVGEIDRPVALVDSYESVAVFMAELHERLMQVE